MSWFHLDTKQGRYPRQESGPLKLETVKAEQLSQGEKRGDRTWVLTHYENMKFEIMNDLMLEGTKMNVMDRNERWK